MPKYKSVVFIDLDQTLIEGPWRAIVFPRILGEISQQTGLEYRELLGMVRQENLNRLTNPAVSPIHAMDWDDILTQVALRLGVTLKTGALDLVRAHTGPPHTLIHLGVHDALSRLASRRGQRAVVLATKGLIKYQSVVIEACGLAGYFDDILTPDSSMAVKQSLAFYGRWPNAARLKIMVGDLLEEDVRPARSFGFKTVWVNRQNADLSREPDPFARPCALHLDPLACPDAVIVSLFELPAIVERLEQGALPGEPG